MGRRVSARKKRKYWITVYASPIFFGEARPITKIVYNDPYSLINRIVMIKAGEFLGTYDPEERGMSLFFRIVKVTPSGAQTVFIGHEYPNEIVLSKVRRRMSRAETIIRVYSKDGHRIKVSALAVTIQRAHQRHLKLIRKTFEEFIAEKAKEYEHEEFLYRLIIKKEWNGELIDLANRIYPIRDFLIYKSRNETLLIDKDELSSAVEGESEIISNSETFTKR